MLALDLELADLRAKVVRLRAENERLLRMLRLTPAEATAPGPAQSGLFEQPPGPVHARSDSSSKVAFFRAMFACRRDVYATRWENNRTGRAGWVPAVPGGWRRGSGTGRPDYLPLTDEVLTAHLSGEVHVGLYPLLLDNRYLGGGGLRRAGGPAGCPVVRQGCPSPRRTGSSRGLAFGVGAHVWTFSSTPSRRERTAPPTGSAAGSHDVARRDGPEQSARASAP